MREDGLIMILDGQKIYSSEYGYIDKCRFCDMQKLKHVIHLGFMPLCNDLSPTAEMPQALYPLCMVICSSCGLAQLNYTINPDIQFREYHYQSSYVKSVVDNAKYVSDYVMNHVLPYMVINKGRQDKTLIMEIASNDGYLLQFYQKAGYEVIGIDPAMNIAKIAGDKGIKTICEFFSKQLALNLFEQGYKADIIHANNVLAHVPDINGFIEGLSIVLKPHGLIIIEVPYIKNLIDICAFDTIYHEHIFYYSLKVLSDMFLSHGLVVVDYEYIELNGGSLRLFVKHMDIGFPSIRVRSKIIHEIEIGLNKFEYYKDFDKRCQKVKQDLLTTLASLRQQGKTIAGYAASGKGCILLNYCSIDIQADLLAYIVDSNPSKQGLFMPHIHIPIKPTEALSADYALILSWNIANEIIAKERAYTQATGIKRTKYFIVPIPTIRIIELSTPHD